MEKPKQLLVWMFLLEILRMAIKEKSLWLFMTKSSVLLLQVPSGRHYPIMNFITTDWLKQIPVWRDLSIETENRIILRFFASACTEMHAGAFSFFRNQTRRREIKPKTLRILSHLMLVQNAVCGSSITLCWSWFRISSKILKTKTAERKRFWWITAQIRLLYSLLIVWIFWVSVFWISVA